MTALFTPQLPDRTAREIVPGAHHIPDWLALEQQEWIVDRFREWVQGPVPLRAAKVRGHQMSVRTVCLGWHWQPYQYTRAATDVNGARVLPFPDWMIRLGRYALRATGHDAATVGAYTPDTALVNYYDANARLGMHQDKDEKSRAPVVSLSIGDTCAFRFGNTENRNKPYTELLLASGDLFVFGGPARLAYHGVTKVHEDTAPEGCGISGGRINITMRMTGFDG
ncbi:alpha-ketoglutarate-dependent dioxygenase AlkB family protein [Streptomyces sp. CMB-StM0423]|uniref:alpha-ketoglutarate-dependent dioxygenase AlkB family protein n=1 Tax=Streptomyces sp. CMB-StM0423 TaxID=2059884 RepID=UPI000C712FAB|nr:alpha-ketoglutarate-dependent dioxygenase AlkB [Streptomyces sp. CMB-StM0423]AUH39130.1 alpha-ketoglutarate-dependent dioxygenase AlkB [Streptomyces sp. CMB-StM0423]